MMKPKVIKGGKHTMKGRFPFPILGAKKIHYRIKFDESARYQTMLSSNQQDWNKLIGFVDGFKWGERRDQYERSTQGKGWLNSARIGWFYWPAWDEIVLCSYCYVNGNREITEMGSVKIGEVFEVHISKEPGFYRLQVTTENNYKVELIRRDGDSTKIFGFPMFPYFGGDERAPHDITIAMQKL